MWKNYLAISLILIQMYHIFRFSCGRLKSRRSLTSSDAKPPFVLAVELAVVLKRVCSTRDTLPGLQYPLYWVGKDVISISVFIKARAVNRQDTHTHTHTHTHTPSLKSRQHVNNEPTWQQAAHTPTCAHGDTSKESRPGPAWFKQRQRHYGVYLKAQRTCGHTSPRR